MALCVRGAAELAASYSCGNLAVNAGGSQVGCVQKAAARDRTDGSGAMALFVSCAAHQINHRPVWHFGVFLIAVGLGIQFGRDTRRDGRKACRGLTCPALSSSRAIPSRRCSVAQCVRRYIVACIARVRGRTTLLCSSLVLIERDGTAGVSKE